MGKTAKIAISLPQELLQGVERERQASGETRSEFFRRAVETFLRQKRERDSVQQYVKGYQRRPESGEEVALASSLIPPALADTPWEEEAKR